MARKKNRRKQAATVKFPAKWAAFLVLAAVFSLSYLWLCGRAENLGLEIKQLERDMAEIKVRVQSEEYKWSNLTSPQRFEEILRAHDLTMSWPDESRVVRIRTSSLQNLQREGMPPIQFAQNTSGQR